MQYAGAQGRWFNLLWRGGKLAAEGDDFFALGALAQALNQLSLRTLAVEMAFAGDDQIGLGRGFIKTGQVQHDFDATH